MAAPSSAQPSATTGSWANRNVSATHPQLAPLMASRESPAPERIPMIAQMPISEPTANSRLGQLTRLASASLGTSMPAPAATAPRSWGSRSLWCWSAATVTGSSAERCRCTRAARAVSASSTRAAAAAVRSAPARTAIAPSAAARSPSRRPAGAEADARRKSRTQMPRSDTMMVSPPSAPWAMRASRSRSTASRISSRVASARPAPSACDRAGPSGTLVTSAASRLGPNWPAASTSGTRTPARPAISVR